MYNGEERRETCATIFDSPIRGLLSSSQYGKTAALNFSAFCEPVEATDASKSIAMWRQLPSSSIGWRYNNNPDLCLHTPYSSTANLGDVRRKNTTRESTCTLKLWLYEHIKNPYPTKGEKIMLAIITKMTLTQVSTWFANARRRLKKENKMQWLPRNQPENDEDEMDEEEEKEKEETKNGKQGSKNCRCSYNVSLTDGAVQETIHNAWVNNEKHFDTNISESGTNDVIKVLTDDQRDNAIQHGTERQPIRTAKTNHDGNVVSESYKHFNVASPGSLPSTDAASLDRSRQRKASESKATKDVGHHLEKRKPMIWSLVDIATSMPRRPVI